MSLNLSNQKKDYLRRLKKSMQIRKEITEIDSQLIQCEEENKNDYDTVAELEKKYTNLKSAISPKSAMITHSDYLELSGSMQVGTSTSLNYIGCSSPLNVKKSLRDYEITACTENIIEELEDSCVRFFEQFFVLGFGQNAENVLYSYPNERSIEVESVNYIRNVAFPHGIQPSPLRDDESILTQVFEVLYKSYYRNGSSFTSLLPLSNGKNPSGLSEINLKKTLYVCCVVFEELGADPISGSLYIAPQCYCFTTYFPCFELHFEVLYRMLALKRTCRSENIQTLFEVANFYQSSSRFTMVDEEKGLLENYFEYLSEASFEKGMRIWISLQHTENIEYLFPNDFSYLDKSWFCPLLFSMVSVGDYFFLLCAMLQEKRIVFMSKDLDCLSSTVLGFQSLLRPFHWQNPIIPIYSSEIHGELEANCFIIGIPDKTPSWISLSSFICYDIDIHQLTSHKKSDYCEVNYPYSYNLLEYIRDDYQEFQGNICYLASETLVNVSKCIIEETKKFTDWVLDELVRYCNTKNILDFEIYREMIRNHAGEDCEFFSSILNTDLFMHAFAHNF